MTKRMRLPWQSKRLCRMQLVNNNTFNLMPVRLTFHFSSLVCALACFLVVLPAHHCLAAWPCSGFCIEAYFSLPGLGLGTSADYYDSQAHVTPHHAHPHLYTPSGSGSPTFHLPSHAAFPSSIMPAPWPTSGSADSTCPPTGVIPDAAIYHTPTTPQFHRPTSHTVAVLQRAASDPFIASGASSSAIATAAQQHPASPHPHLHQDADHRPHSHSHPPHLHHHPQGPATGMPPTPFSPSAATYSTLLSPSSPLSPSSTATTTSGEGMFHPHLSHASSSPSMSTSPTTGLHPHRPTPLQQQSVHPGHVMAVPSTRSAHLRRTTSAGLVPLSFHPPPPPPLRHAHSSHHASTMSPSSSSSSSGGPYHGLGIASAMDFGSGASFGSVGDAGGPVAGSSSQRTTATGGPMRLSMPLTRQAKRLRIAKHEPMSNMTAIGGDVHSQDHDDDDDDDDDDNDDEDDMEEEERGQPRPQHLLRSAGPSTRTNSTSTLHLCFRHHHARFVNWRRWWWWGWDAIDGHASISFGI